LDLPEYNDFIDPGGLMKKLFATALVLCSLSSFAQEQEAPLSTVLKVASCEIKITNSPIIFGKEQAHGRSHKMIFLAHESSSQLRRMSAGRRLKITGISSKTILLDDLSLSSICILNQKNKCSRGLKEITATDIERSSGGNVKVLCKKDPIKDI
jgi:hypothetical protein